METISCAPVLWSAYATTGPKLGGSAGTSFSIARERSMIMRKFAGADSTCFSAQPFQRRSPGFELPATQNQQLSGMRFDVPKSTVIGTEV